MSIGLFIVGLAALSGEPARAGHRGHPTTACAAPCDCQTSEVRRAHPSSYSFYHREKTGWKKMGSNKSHAALYWAGKHAGWTFVHPRHWQAPKTRDAMDLFTISPDDETPPNEIPDMAPTEFYLYFCANGTWGYSQDQGTDYDALYKKGLDAMREWAECSESCGSYRSIGAFTICTDGENPGGAYRFCPPAPVCEPAHRGLFGRLHARRSGCGPCR
jgi:hypothetical protein